MSRRLILSSLGAIALALAACSSDSSTGPETSPGILGTYVLQTANGAQPPVLLYSYQGGENPADSGSVYVRGDTLTVGADGTYRQSSWFVGRQGATVIGTAHWGDHGVWTRQGNTLHFDSGYIEDVAFDATLTPQGQLATTRDILGDGGTAAYVLRRL